MQRFQSFGRVGGAAEEGVEEKRAFRGWFQVSDAAISMVWRSSVAAEVGAEMVVDGNAIRTGLSGRCVSTAALYVAPLCPAGHLPTRGRCPASIWPPVPQR